MIRRTLALAFATLLPSVAAAQTRSHSEDTLRIQSKEVIVTGFPISPGGGIAPTEILPRPLIRSLSTEQDVAKMTSITPSATFYSESGLDLGYTHLSMRGIDQRRISILVNGIPQNGPEDQEVYWIDMPGLQANASAIDIQRGAGSAYYGPPAIGGSINVHTDLSPVRSFELTAGYGSYNTRSYALSGNSGLIGDKYIIYGRLGLTHTDGYRHFSWLDRSPYFFSIARYDSSVTTQINVYGGVFQDGLSYYGIDKASLDGPDSVRRYNPSETFTYERRPEEGERFTQPHYEVLNEWRLDDHSTLYNTLFYIEGEGYFDIDGTWPSYYYGISNAEYYRLTEPYASRYRFTPIEADSNFLSQIYRGFVGNKQWGWLPRFEWKHDDGILAIAGEFRLHRSQHYGQLLKASELPPDLPGDYHFYDFRVAKDIGNISALERYNATEDLEVTLGVQLVNERYRFYDQKPFFVDSAMAIRRNVASGWTSYEFSVPFQFFNPRLGARLKIGDNLAAFASGSFTSREPRFSDYYAADFLSEPNFSLNGFGGYDFGTPLVHPETVRDLELGADLLSLILGESTTLSGRLNFYHMAFKDETILSGHTDNFGSPVQLNAKSTVHYGAEAEARLSASHLLTLGLSAAISHNEILDLDTFALHLPSTVIGNAPPGVPSFVANGIVTVTPVSWLRLDVIGRYLGGLYADIENTEPHHLDPYFVSDAVATARVPDVLGLPLIEAKLQVNNVFDRNYAAMATGAGFFPGAPRNFFGSITIGL
jgi:iron complex outermembrane receptor protein